MSETHVPVSGLYHVRLGRDTLPAALLLHGITESHRYFTTRLKPLARSFHLVIPDLPGFGRSPKPVTRYTIGLFLDAIERFVSEQGLASRPMHLVGHSLGAVLAAEYAARRPEAVDRLVLINLPLFDDPQDARRVFWNGSPSYRRLLMEHSLRENLAQLRRVGLTPALRNAAGIPLRVLFDCRRFTFQSLTSTLENCLLGHSVGPAIGRMPPRPTLLVHGERDQVAPFSRVAELAARHGHMALRSFGTGGHHVLHTHPRACAAAIAGHLSNGASR